MGSRLCILDVEALLLGLAQAPQGRDALPREPGKLGQLLDECHTRAVLSDEAVTMWVPSRPNPAALTPPSWPRRTRGTPLPSARHTRAVLSAEPVTMRVPSGRICCVGGL
jgi:hypothetical protein